MTPRELLMSPLVDARFLFRGYGLRRDQVDAFCAVYNRLAPGNRPPLSPFFDPRWYAASKPGYDGFVDFVVVGMARRKSPHPLIRLHYMEKLRGPFAGGMAGMGQLVTALCEGTVPPSPYFDQSFYLAAKPEAAGFVTGPLGHFLEADPDNCVVPCPWFDADFYRARYADAPQTRRDAFLHFCAMGDYDRRLPGPAFDSDWYFHNNADLASASVAPLYHYLEFGRAEGRRAVSPNGRASAGAASSIVVSTGGIVPPNHEQGRARYEAMRARLHAARAERVAAVVEREARSVVLAGKKSLPVVKLPKSRSPKLSIIIPVFNQMRVTVECLQSIAKDHPKTPIEVIVADDCSTDPAVRTLATFPGVVYVRHRENLNFLRSCNAALAQCRGDYILLLNNDAQVCKGAIDALCAALDADPEVGAVGPRFLFPNGRLQEAGCSIGEDATTNMIGVFESADNPSYSYARDVDYVSGAALMVRRALLGDGLFDQGLAPAYCEDQDLCLRIAAQGYRIRYEPAATVVHHLSTTMTDHGLKMQRIVTNQQYVFAKWHDQLKKMNRIRAIAFYLPQFHSTPENDLWWGKGFTEWTNVSKALPSYRDHYQPHLPADLGFYDLRVPQILREQAKLLQRYSMAGLCLYYYNFNGQAFLSRPLENLLDDATIPLNFCLCWANENWSRRWDGGDQELLIGQHYDEATIEGVERDLIRAAADPRYLTIDGRPIFLIYRPMIIPEVAALVARLRDRVRAALSVELYLIFVESMESVDTRRDPRDDGFDAAVEFPPHGLGEPATDARDILKPDWTGHRYDYEHTVQRAILRPGVPWERFPSVFPSWDNTARQPLKGTSFDFASPEVFKFYVEQKIAETRRLFVGDKRMIFINAWNEWAEGAHLEPDLAYGHRWLEALRDAIHGV